MWRQFVMITPTMPLTPLGFKNQLTQVIPTLDLSSNKVRVHGIRDEKDAEMIVAQCSQPDPTYQKDPKSNEAAVLSHFTGSFDKSVDLCEKIMQVITNNPKKHDWASIADLLYPVYAQFTHYVTNKRIYFMMRKVPCGIWAMMSNSASISWSSCFVNSLTVPLKGMFVDG